MYPSGCLSVDTSATFVNGGGGLFCKDRNISGSGVNELGRLVSRAVGSQVSN